MSKHLVCDTCGADVPPEGLYSFPPEGWYTLTLRCNTTTPDRERHFCCPACVIAGVKRDIKIGGEAIIDYQPIGQPERKTPDYGGTTPTLTSLADPRD